MTLAVVPGLGKRKSYARIPLLLETPNLIQIQQESYKWVCDPAMDGGLKELAFRYRRQTAASES